MSNTNYDVELPIAYDLTKKHYIPTYTVRVPAFSKTWYSGEGYRYNTNCIVSLDDGAETELKYHHPVDNNWSIITTPGYIENGQYIDGTKLIPDSGVFNKLYIRNPRRDIVRFTTSNCALEVLYQIKAPFEVQWNATGFAANQNASFRCSTIPKNTYKQYEWASCTVYYKASSAPTYSSIAGTITGTWSDYTISTNLTLADGITYNVYIRAVADDGSVATTPVAQFTTTDASAIATCIAPSGAFTSGNVTFVWSHTTAYGTPQYAYDLQYSNNNGSSWTTVGSHVVTPNTSATATLTDAGVYLWRVRTYNSNDVVGEWAEATFVNQMPANPPTNVQITTKGRPTVSWVSVSQSAYQVQFLLGNSIAYDSGAVYTSETSHFVNWYFDDNRSYTVRVRIYNALGEISDWIEVGYQQPSVTDVEFTVTANNVGGATITVTPDAVFTKYYVLRNNKPIARISGTMYTDNFAIGVTSYSVVAVTSDDQSDIQTQNVKVTYPKATLITKSGHIYAINKRVDTAYEVQTSNQASINKAQFLGDDYPSHYPSNMRLKSFNVQCFDDQGIMEGLLGTLVFYADNFGNGGWCMVTAYEKTDKFVKNSQGSYANEVSLTLEVTNYDDSIEYPI